MKSQFSSIRPATLVKLRKDTEEKANKPLISICRNESIEFETCQFY